MESNFIDGKQIGYNRSGISNRLIIYPIYLIGATIWGGLITFLFEGIFHIGTGIVDGSPKWWLLLILMVIFLVSLLWGEHRIKVIKGRKKYFYYNDGIANDSNIKLPWGMFSFVKISDRKCSIVIKNSENSIDFEIQSNLGIQEVLEVLNKKISENQVQLTDEEIKEKAESVFY